MVKKKAHDFVDYLKKVFILEPILSLTDFQTGKFVVASTQGIGAIVSQIINEEEKIIAYASRTLTPGESNYSDTQLGLISIIVVFYSKERTQTH